ncbi:MAG: DEAD/DEAH box helicase [Hyphomicrobiaceae bacterium]
MHNPSFSKLGLSAKVEAAVATAGYATPTPIQAQAIPVAVTGLDILGIAQTGTGKTASFTLPMITRLETGRARARMPRSLILAPTRELAAQVAQAFESYGVNHKLNIALLIGGVSFDDQERKLDRGADVLIATPGRLIDHFQRGKLLLTGVEILVIDEADRMLDMGFIPDIEKICRLLPPQRQTLFFSATMPPEIQRLVDQFLRNPVRIEVARPATTANTIRQSFRFCPDSEDWAKREILRELIQAQDVKNAIIFCNRKRDVAILFKSLTKDGFNAGALHGDMDQASRMATLDKFRTGEIKFLAASDVAARGLDIPDVSHVFNFDVPWAGDDYVHRIGRTGRAGREGVAATLVTVDDLKQIREIEKIIGQALAWDGQPPSDDDFDNAGKKKQRGRAGRSRGSSATSERRNPTRGKRTGATSHAVKKPTSAIPQDRDRSMERGTQSNRAESKHQAPAGGFTADSIPAFLQRPIRPAKNRKPVKTAGA